MPRHDESNLRRLNHLVGEDFYFLSYSILIALRTLPPRGSNFRDHRKLAHVIQFISDSRLLSILDRTRDKQISNAVDRELLFAAFSKAELLKREIYKLLLSMDRRDLVTAEPSKSAPGLIDISLKTESVSTEFFENELFNHERANARTLRTMVPRLSSLTMETFLERVYISRGVRAWAL